MFNDFQVIYPLDIWDPIKIHESPMVTECLPDLRTAGAIGHSSSHRGVQEDGSQHAVGVS